MKNVAVVVAVFIFAALAGLSATSSEILPSTAWLAEVPVVRVA